MDDLHKPDLASGNMQSIEDLLADHCLSCKSLSVLELRGYSAKQGWRLQVVAKLSVVEILLVLTPNWPFEPPDFYLVDKSKFSIWPHVERSGRLCLQHRSTVEISPYRPLKVILEFLVETLSLLDQLTANELVGDFYEEFESYWSQEVPVNATPIYSLICPGFCSGQIVIWRGRNFTLIGENEDQVRSWMKNRFRITTQNYEFGFLAKLGRGLLPSEFPKTGQQLHKLLEDSCSNFEDISLHSLLRNQRSGLVVLESESRGDSSFVGVEIVERRKIYFSPVRSRKQTHIRVNGFRDGRCPKSIETTALFSNSQISPTTILRADSGWIHGGRGQDSRFEILQKQRVVIIGAGSIGSFVANNLAQAGVGKIGIADPDLLSWANTGRHLLGAEYVGCNKALAVTRKLLQDYPTMKSCVASDFSWEETYQSRPDFFEGCDLLVSLTGSWRTESQLNDWHKSKCSEIPAIYGWLEPFASAGHAVCIVKTGGCLQCGFSETGLPRLPVFEWPSVKTTMRKETGCGTYFQPYGVAESLHTIAMISEMATECLLSPHERSMHRIWVRKEGLFEPTRRQWSAAWLQSPVTTNELDRVFDLEWTQRSDCPRCAK